MLSPRYAKFLKDGQNARFSVLIHSLAFALSVAGVFSTQRNGCTMVNQLLVTLFERSYHVTRILQAIFYLPFNLLSFSDHV
jgi:cytochrome c biogenesis protein CcdA